MDAQLIGSIAAALIVLGATLIAYVHVGDRGLDPIQSFVSSYALNPRFKHVINSAFALIGLGGVLLSTALYSEFAKPVSFIFAGGAACIGLLGYFVTQSKQMLFGRTYGDWHDWLVTAGFVMFIVSMAWIAGSPISSDWKSTDEVSGWAAVITRAVAGCQLNLTIVAAICYVVIITRKGKNGKGLAERFLMILFIEWACFLCWFVIAHPTARAPH
jgi:hypothetical protein